MSKKWEYYETGDTVERKRKSCPKCGAGVYMAQHKNRLSCGKCGYTEFIAGVKPEAPKEAEVPEGGEPQKEEAKPEVKAEPPEGAKSPKGEESAEKKPPE